IRLESPMVGTFYRSPSPSQPAFVDEGDRVEIGQTLCILEAMKLYNEFKAEHAGVIRRILVANAEPVEYGQPLLELEPARWVERAALRAGCNIGVRPHWWRGRCAEQGVGGEPGRVRRAHRPCLPRPGDRGGRRLLDRRSRRPLGRAGRPGGVHRPAPAGGELP